MANYYGKFIAIMSDNSTALRINKTNSIYTWGEKEQTAFNSLKKILAYDVVLAHYNPAKEIEVAADASAYGIEAVLFHFES